MRRWFKLDNAAKIYPPTRTRTWSAMFRLSVTLREEVDPVLLAEAQKNALRRFPSFACRLRRGLFWYYLEQMDDAPPIIEDVYNPMQNLNFAANRHFMYRLLYYKNRIAVEYFHALTDGTGGMTFLLSLTNEYLRLTHGTDASPAKYILSCSETPSPEEYEDSFLRYYDKTTIGRAESVSYHTGGKPVPLNRLLIISGTVPTDILAEKAKSYGVSIGVFLAAVLLYAVHKHQLTERSARKRRKPVKVSIPVNLRRYFPSRTLRNFSSYVNPGIESRLGEHSFAETVSIVDHFMGLHITQKELRARFSANVASEMNPLIRIAPLFLKKPILRAAFSLRGDRCYAATLSNLGLVTLPDEIGDFVDRLDFILGRSTTARSVCACVSYRGQTVINFSRTAMESDIERRFFCELIEMGVPVRVESNGRY